MQDLATRDELEEALAILSLEPHSRRGVAWENYCDLCLDQLSALIRENA